MRVLALNPNTLSLGYNGKFQLFDSKSEMTKRGEPTLVVLTREAVWPLQADYEMGERDVLGSATGNYKAGPGCYVSSERLPGLKYHWHP